jgi:hypothetical protein
MHSWRGCSPPQHFEHWLVDNLGSTVNGGRARREVSVVPKSHKPHECSICEAEMEDLSNSL